MLAGDMEDPDTLLGKLIERLTTLKDAAGELIKRTSAKHLLLRRRAPLAPLAKYKIIDHRRDVMAKAQRAFLRRTKRAAVLCARPGTDLSVAVEVIELAIHQGQWTIRELQRYEATLDELLTAV